MLDQKHILEKILLSRLVGICIWILKMILPVYLAWFWIDFLKWSSHPVLKWLTGISERYFIWAVGLFALGYLLDFIRNYFKNNKIKKLEEVNLNLSTDKDILKSELTTISSIIKDQSNDTLRVFAIECLSANDWETMRISLYTKNTEWWLTCYSRFSKNQTYLQIKWKIYNQHGIIGKVWEEWNNNELWLFDNDIPEYWESKNKQKNYIKYHQRKYSLEENYIKNISMKSRLYYAYRIEMEWENLWVLLIESLDPDKYTKEQLDNIVPTFSKNLYIVLKTAKHVMSDVGESYKNNFNS